MQEHPLTALQLAPRKEFVITPQIGQIIDRAGAYLQAGYPVHFSGAPGTGKTSLALHLAATVGRPVVLIHGDDEYDTSDLVGSNSGYRRSRVVDNYIHSVLKTEDRMQKHWTDNRLTSACKHGLTLVYDEFTRSRPEANNILLSVLEEKLLDLPAENSGDPYLMVHPDFRAIFTSNPEEYVGVHKTQDALLDRMISIPLDHYDLDTETAIAASCSGLDRDRARKIVALVREFREVGVHNHKPTVRRSIMLARLVQLRGMRIDVGDPIFRQLCKDILSMETIKVTREGKSMVADKVEECLRKMSATVCEPDDARRRDSRPARTEIGVPA